MDDKDFNLERLNEILKVHKIRKDFKRCEYMNGFYNGLELAVAILEDREPIYERRE